MLDSQRQRRRPIVGDDAQQVAVELADADGVARRRVARPVAHLEAAQRADGGDAALVTDRHGDGVTDTGLGTLRDERVSVTERDAMEAILGADEGCLVTGHAVAVAEDDGRESGADGELGRDRRGECASGPAQQPRLGREGDAAERWQPPVMRSSSVASPSMSIASTASALWERARDLVQLAAHRS